MRPTPETDAAELGVADYAVTLEEARGVIRRLTRRVSELERERDEARDIAKRLEYEAIDMRFQLDLHATKQLDCELSVREHDEASDALAKAQSKLDMFFKQMKKRPNKETRP